MSSPRATARQWTAPTTIPFEVRAARGRLWIRPQWAQTDSTDEVELSIKGANWGGFETYKACPEQGDAYPYANYIAALTTWGFNAVRFPLAASTLYYSVHDGARWHKPYYCAEYSTGHFTVLDALEDLIDRLALRGIFVMLDMHSVSAAGANDALWCPQPGSDGTATEGCMPAPGPSPCLDAVDARACGMAHASEHRGTEAPLINAWVVLARRFCSKPNVIVADVFNEPHGGHWGDPSRAAGRNWFAAAHRIGEAILGVCPRWLIAVQGVAWGSGECQNAVGTACWVRVGQSCLPASNPTAHAVTHAFDAHPLNYRCGCASLPVAQYGENVLGEHRAPIELSVPERLVISPHLYGHGHQSYMNDPDFPRNMPAIWDGLWGALANETGAPITIGEWGGHWTYTAACVPSTVIYSRPRVRAARRHLAASTRRLAPLD